jgi:hypothetical protein
VTEYRRNKQVAYNKEHNIPPRSVSRAVEESLVFRAETREQAAGVLREAGMDVDITETIKEIEEEMLNAANNLEFEKAALLRDQIKELKRAIDGQPSEGARVVRQVSYRKPEKIADQCGVGAGVQPQLADKRVMEWWSIGVFNVPTLHYSITPIHPFSTGSGCLGLEALSYV